MTRKNLGFALMTALLVAIIGFCAVRTVSGHAPAGEDRESWYRVREAELLDEMREYLDGSGYRNSGVTLTRVVDAQGRREYTFTIHHGRIDRMDEAARQELKGKLADLCLAQTQDFEEDVCSFRYDLLILDSDR